MRFEIVNPSDPVVIEADSLDVAAIACVALGRGKYAFDPIDPVDGAARRIPLFLFGGADEWFREQFQRSPDDLASDILDDPARRESLASCLDSARIKGCETKEESDKARSSMNDICGRGWALAANIRSKKG